jgi:hypothetical protein
MMAGGCVRLIPAFCAAAVFYRAVAVLVLLALIILPHPAIADNLADGIKAYSDSHYELALKKLLPLAKKGNRQAQRYIGTMYLNGNGVKDNTATAIQWYRKAAGQGDATAQYELGEIYYSGYGVPEDYPKAAQWYRKAADQGSADAQDKLGDIYRWGQGVPQDNEKAVQWYQKAAAQGNYGAQNSLVELGILRGDAVSDVADAILYYNKGDYKTGMQKLLPLAESGNAAANVYMGHLYRLGQGVPQDNDKAVQWYRNAADRGNAEATRWYEKTIALDSAGAAEKATAEQAAADKAAAEKVAAEKAAAEKVAAEQAATEKAAAEKAAAEQAAADKAAAEKVAAEKAAAEKVAAEQAATEKAAAERAAAQVAAKKAAEKVAAEQAAAEKAAAEQAAVRAAAAKPLGKRVALVIGNGAYVNTTKLPNPPNDASAIADTLKALGFTVVLAIDVDRRGFVKAIREFRNILPDSDDALFFYAGHGLQVNGENYLVPVDAVVEDELSLDSDLILANAVLQLMGRESRVSIALLDACRDNPMSRSLAGKGSASRSLNVARGLALVDSPAAGSIIGYATAPGDTAADGDGEHSPFTAALLKYLPTRGLEVEQMMKRVKADVIKSTNNRQRPWLSSDVSEDVYLAP